MAVENKFADEIMSDEELDMVAGGTKQELQELYSAMASDRIICKLKIVLEAKKALRRTVGGFFR